MFLAQNSDELVWFKSTRSAGNGQCVEVATTSDRVAMRDSKDRSGPVLRFDVASWQDFITAIRGGEFGGPSA